MATARPLAQTLGAPRSIQGIDFAAGTQVFFGLSNELVASMIPHDQLIADVPCAAGLVHFHPDGELFQATLARDFDVRGLRLLAGTLVSWNEDGTLSAHLRTPTHIGAMQLAAGSHVRLTERGELESWWRRADDGERVHGLPCQAASIVTFYGCGRVQRATLAEDHTIGPVVALGGADVELHRNGNVAVVTLAEPYTHAGVTFEPGTLLVFRQDGTLSVAHLTDPLTVGDTTYPDGAYLRFDAHERLSGHAALTWEVQHRARI